MKERYIYNFIAHRFEIYAQKKWNANIDIGGISGNVITNLTIRNLSLTDIKGYPKELRLKIDTIELSYLPLGLLWWKFNADFRGVKVEYKDIVLPLDAHHRRGLTTVSFKKRFLNLETLEGLLPTDIVLVGLADVSGEVILKNFKPHLLNISLNGKDCQARFGTNLKGKGSINLEMNGRVDKPSISGIVSLAQIALPDGLGGLSSFQIPKRSLSLGFLKSATLNIDIQGKGILARNHYINAPLNVFLKLKKEANDELYLLGEIEIIKGIYEAYGNQFKISKGEIIFMDKNRSPLIDIAAETRIRRYRIFAKIKGDLEDSRLTLTSKPELSYSEIVSLIVFGKNIDNLTNAQKGQFTASDFNDVFINGLFMGKAETKLAKAIGLDDISIHFDTSSNDFGRIESPSVEIGKSIVDEKVYGTYSIKPSDSSSESPEQAVGSEIELTEHVRLKGQRSWQEAWQSPKEDKVSVEFRWKF